MSNATAEHLLTVNALCPTAVLRGAVPVVGDGDFLAVGTGSIVAAPLTGTADYAASKAALACWPGVLAPRGPPPLRRAADPAAAVTALLDPARSATPLLARP
ncbi:hypothetical protein ACFV7Q_37195 [Streptomyces sp. NPDC059851]|uniref:hypothetical protein n=1 Tax=Streptomyces sp. NPDC059851 TaxID=3346971 RepID=UPI003656CA99